MGRCKVRNPTFEKCQTEKKLDLTATINAKMAYSAAELVALQYRLTMIQ